MNPGTGVINENPNFINFQDWNFELQNNSPCINSGNPNFIDSDGTFSDIGANNYSNLDCSTVGDINIDSEVNILDIVQLSICILDNSCAYCSDINNDNNIDVIDIVLIVNIILSQ